MRPLAIDLFCGLGGWTEGLIAEGYDVIGFDIERHQYGDMQYQSQLVLQNVLTIHGRQFKDAALIVASPPCQEFSYMAMPWSKAKAIRAEYLSGVRDKSNLTALFDACFRIQREAIEAAGHFIPLVVENVRGAQEWVGRSRWNFGSFHLWGDVPALMPIPGRKIMKNTGGSWFAVDNRGQSTEANCARDAIETGIKAAGMNWSDRSRRGQDFTRIAGNQAAGTKQHGSGREWFAGEGKISRVTSSKSPARKAASAMIAKIPIVLSRHIAATWRPRGAEDSGGECFD